MNTEYVNDNMRNFLLHQNENNMNDIALSFGNVKVTYEELHTRIDEYSRALYKRGVRAGDIISLAIANTPESVYIIYALNSLGAVCCPMFPIQNEYKMYSDLNLVKPKMFIGINDSYSKVKKAINGKADLSNLDIILFSPLESVDNKYIKAIYNAKQLLTGNFVFNSKNNLNDILKNGINYQIAKYPEYKSGTLSHIMFTGGSSGFKKGAMLTSNGINNLVVNVSKFSSVEPGEVFMGNLPFNITFGCLALHTALCNNLNVALTLKALPKDFSSELERIHPSIVYAGPIHYQYLVNQVIGELNDKSVNKIDFSNRKADTSIDEYLGRLKNALDRSNIRNHDFTQLKCAVSGGEQLTYFAEHAANIVMNYFGYNDKLWNGLGMTELWGTVSLKRGNLDDDGTIGKVIPQSKIKIINQSTGLDVKQGAPGVLYISNPSMMLGYYNDEQSTNETIIDGFIKTGDIVMQKSNGELVYIDRAKRQFVCDIDNVYPQQIENLLSRIPEIDEVVVTKIADPILQFVPKYHIYLRDELCDTSKLEKRINTLVEKELGNSNVARYFEYHKERLPRTQNGKLDYKPLQKSDDEGELSKIKSLTIK